MNVNIGLSGLHWCFVRLEVWWVFFCSVGFEIPIAYLIVNMGLCACFHSVHDSSNHPSEVFSWKIGSRAFSQDFCPITALIETHCFWKERLGFGRICSGMMRIGGGCIKPTGILTPHLLVTTHYPCSICNVMPFIFTLTKLDKLVWLRTSHLHSTQCAEDVLQNLLSENKEELQTAAALHQPHLGSIFHWCSRKQHGEYQTRAAAACSFSLNKQTHMQAGKHVW